MKYTLATMILERSSKCNEIYFSIVSSFILNFINPYRYHDKKATTKSLAYEKKKHFAQARNYQWMVSSKRPYKLKQYLKELEVFRQDTHLINELLDSNRLISHCFRTS